MQSLPLDLRLDRVAQHILRARLFFDLWFYFEGQGTRRKIFETMDEYSEFFRFTPHAYLVSYVIYMAGVFDKRSDTITLVHLIPEVKKAGSLNDQVAAKIDKLLAEAIPLAEKVTILRHKAFAHRDAHISYNDVFKIAAVKPDELRHLTDVALAIANKLLLSRGLRDQYFNELPQKRRRSDDGRTAKEDNESGLTMKPVGCNEVRRSKHIAPSTSKSNRRWRCEQRRNALDLLRLRPVDQSGYQSSARPGTVLHGAVSPAAPTS